MTYAPNGAGLITALAAPFENIAGRQAARQEAVQLGEIINQTEQRDVLAEQQAAAQEEMFLAQMRRKPLVGNDVTRLKEHVRQVQKDAYQRLKDRYDGSWKQMMAVEGPAWMADKQAELEESTWYKQAVSNKEQVMAAQAALAKNEILIGAGGGDPTKYRRGEADLMDFLTGKADSYRMLGSYKQEDDLKELRGTYAPGVPGWQRTAVSEADKLAFLVNAHGKEVGLDKYLRQHVGVPTFYKTDPITEKIKFQNEQERLGMDRTRLGMEQQRLNMAWQTQRENATLHAQQRELNDLKIKEKKGELSGQAGASLAWSMLNKPAETIAFVSDDKNKKLPHSGVQLGQIRTLGGTALFGDAEALMANQMGVGRMKGGGFTKGNIREGFTPQNGGAAFDLSKSNFQVMGINPHVFYDRAEVGTNPSNGGGFPRGLMGYSQVTVRFNSHADASKAGLYDDGMIWNSDTKGGTGVYDPETNSATLLVPIGKIDPKNNATFWRTQHNEAYKRQDYAPDSYTPYVPPASY